MGDRNSNVFEVEEDVERRDAMSALLVRDSKARLSAVIRNSTSLLGAEIRRGRLGSRHRFIYQQKERDDIVHYIEF